MALIRTGACINTENTFERVRLLEGGRYIESLRYLLIVRKADLYEVLCINSRLKFFGDQVVLSSIISSRSIQKNYNYNTNLQVAVSEQLSETPLESRLRFKNANGPRLPPFHFHLHCFPWFRLESRFQRWRKLPSRGEVCSNKGD